jgi:hypothetical protein
VIEQFIQKRDTGRSERPSARYGGDKSSLFEGLQVSVRSGHTDTEFSGDHARAGGTRLEHQRKDLVLTGRESGARAPLNRGWLACGKRVIQSLGRLARETERDDGPSPDVLVDLKRSSGETQVVQDRRQSGSNPADVSLRLSASGGEAGENGASFVSESRPMIREANGVPGVENGNDGFDEVRMDEVLDHFSNDRVGSASSLPLTQFTDLRGDVLDESVERSGRNVEDPRSGTSLVIEGDPRARTYIRSRLRGARVRRPTGDQSDNSTTF